MIDTPAPIDVLCGKDKTYAKHAGNVVYRQTIQAKAVDYAAAPTKQDKMRMTAEIVSELLSAQGSRFLKCSSQGGWEELSVAAARDKTSHALRFCAARTVAKRSVKRSTTKSSFRLSPSNNSNRRPSTSAAAVTKTSNGHRRTVSWETNSSALAAETTDFSRGLCYQQHVQDHAQLYQNLSFNAEPIPLSVPSNFELDAVWGFQLLWDDIDEDCFLLV